MAENNGTGLNEQNSNGAIGTVRPTDITQEMQVAYLDYAMSVIVARALPDVRDGLKPVHRRILYAMSHDLSLTHDKPHKKSARIVGEVLGKYHPHGDTAVYDAMVRMAQPFSLRYPLVDGQGNFGSIDGDNAAAMRYTEARLAKIADLMLDGLDKDTVEWHANFDNTLREPDILPATLPNLLINGSSGIAVGMATNIPPHNLAEVVDALVYMIDRFDHVDEISTEELMHFISGPDFPTGGIIYRYREEGKNDDDTDAIAQGYSVGKSRLIVQAKAHFEEISRGRTRIVVTELPYQTNKTALIERIADLVRDGKIEGISDLRDESDRTGMRIVVELSRTVQPKDVLADLFKYTPLQQTFGMQLLALVDGQPKLLTLKRMLQLFVQHRQEIVRRRSEYDLARARERAHIVEGLLRALDILDEVIQTIRRSQTVDTARKNLISNFKFTELQAQAILDMQLRRLAALERKKLQAEYDELKQRITYLEDLLAQPKKILEVIKAEQLAIREAYGDARRSQIVDRTRGTLTSTDLLPDQMVWVSVGKNGSLRRQPMVKVTSSVARQVGKDSQLALLTANTRDFLYVFSKDGRCSRIGIHEIPENDGKQVSDLTGFSGRDAMATAVALPREPAEDDAYLFLATELGDVKRVSVVDVQANNGDEFVVFNVGEKDRLLAAVRTVGAQEVILVTAGGQSIRFADADVRSMGLAAGGVGGIRLKGKDRVVYADVVAPEGSLVTFTEHGYAKRSSLAEYSLQGRNGSGIVTHKLTARTGNVAAALALPVDADEDAVVVVTQKGTAKPATIAEVAVMGRGVQGKQLVATADKDSVAAFWRLVDRTPEAGPDDATPAPTPEPSARKPGSQAAAATKAAEPRAQRPVAPRSQPVKTDNGKASVAKKPKQRSKDEEEPPAAPRKARASPKGDSSADTSKDASKQSVSNPPRAKVTRPAEQPQAFPQPSDDTKKSASKRGGQQPGVEPGNQTAPKPSTRQSTTKAQEANSTPAEAASAQIAGIQSGPKLEKGATPAKKAKRSKKPSPAEIAGADRSATGKGKSDKADQPVPLAFDFVDGLETKQMPEKKKARKRATDKLAAVASVTKSQTRSGKKK